MIHIGTKSGRDGKVSSLSIDSNDEDLTPFGAALRGHVWLRINEKGELETSPAHTVPPVVYDEDVDPIWDGKAKTIRLIPPRRDSYDRSIYVQSISGYSGKYLYHYMNHDKILKATVMYFNGFEPLRSQRGDDGLIWEIWYLPGVWSAKGELKDRDEKYILKWLHEVIRPGTVTFSGESWGLSVED